MATDKNYFANGGTGADPIGINAWSQSNFIFDIGVEGHGGAHGVVGWIDTGGSPTAGVPLSASYATGSGVFGGGAAVPGVAGTSGTVGVFGQGGAFATSLPSGAPAACSAHRPAKVE